MNTMASTAATGRASSTQNAEIPDPGEMLLADDPKRPREAQMNTTSERMLSAATIASRMSRVRPGRKWPMSESTRIVTRLAAAAAAPKNDSQTRKNRATSSFHG